MTTISVRGTATAELAAAAPTSIAKPVKVVDDCSDNNENNAAIGNMQPHSNTPNSITMSVGKPAVEDALGDSDKTQFAKSVRDKLSQEFDKLAALLDQNTSDTQDVLFENAGCEEADDTTDEMSAITMDDCSVASTNVPDSTRVPRYTGSASSPTTSSAQRRRSTSRIPVRRQSQSPRSSPSTSAATTSAAKQSEHDHDAVDEQIWARVRKTTQRAQPADDVAPTPASRSTSVPARAARLGLRNGGKSAAAAASAAVASAAAPAAPSTRAQPASRPASPSIRSTSRSKSRARDGLSTEERELQQAALAQKRLHQRIQRNERNMEQNRMAPEVRSTSNLRAAKEPTVGQSPVSHLTQLRGERHYSSQPSDAAAARDRSTSRLRPRPASGGDANTSCASSTRDRSASRLRRRPTSEPITQAPSTSCVDSIMDADMSQLTDSYSCITDCTARTFKSRDPPRSTYEFQPPSFASKKPTVAQAPKLHTNERSQSRSRSTQPTRPSSAASVASRTSTDRSMKVTREMQKAAAQSAPITEPEPFDLQTETRGMTHQQRLQMKMEEERRRRRAESRLRAQAMPDHSEPFQLKPTDRTATDCEEFSLSSAARHEHSMARLKQIEKEREEEAKKAAQFKARPAPSTTARPGFEVRPSSRPVSSPEEPRLSSTTRAESRRAYNVKAEQEAAKKEAARREQMAEKLRRDQAQIRALRKKSIEEGGMAFKAKAVGEGVRTDDIGEFVARPITEPESPQLRSSSRLRARSVGRPRSIAK